MKKKFRAVIPGLTGSCRFFLTASLLILFSLSSISQQNKNLPREHYGDEAGKLLKGAEYLKDGINSPFPSFVRFAANDRVGLNQFFSWLKLNINANAALDFKTVKTESDELGFQHHRYVQTYQNIPIDKSFYILHVKENLVNSFNGTALDIPGKLSAKPGLSEALALQMVLKFVGASKYKWEDAYWTEELKKTRKDSKASYYPQGELVWNTGRENNAFQLAYKFDIYSASPDLAQRIYINASSGAIIRTLPLESNCSAATVNTIFNGVRSISTDNYSGSLFRLRDNCIGSVFYIRDWGSTTTTASPTEIENTTNTWNNNNDERFGASVLWNTKQSDSYWRTVHSRSGYDN